MRSSLQLGQIAGIKIGIHYTLLLGFVLIAWSLATGYFRTVVPSAGAGTDWARGSTAAVLLFAYELSHSLVARTRGPKVDSITLFIFGGVSNLTTEATTPGHEFFVAVVGPIASLVLIPGFPLDGGRVLRSLVWAASGNLPRATQVASYAGQAVGWLLILRGFARLLAGDLLGGLRTAFIGWFLNSAAELTRHEEVQHKTLGPRCPCQTSRPLA
jgi:Zn-dependent protease